MLIAPMGRTVMKCGFSLTALVVGICIANPAGGAEYKAGSIQIDGPWSRATPKGAAIGAGYMTIRNAGTESDRLMSGTADVSADLKLHEMTTEGDVSKMREMKSGIEIKPGELVELKPGSSHVMFVDLKRRLEKGEPIKGTLTFERAGTVTIEYPVQAVWARAMEHGGGDHMQHQH
jgi:copper(I)-binding protein